MYEKGKWILAIFDRQKIMIMMGFRMIIMMGFRDSKNKIRARAGGGVTWLSPCERQLF